MFFRHSPRGAQTIARHETKPFQWRTAFLPQPFANGAQLSSRVPKLSSVQSVAHRETKPFQWRIPRFSQRWPNAHRKTAVCPMDLPATFRPVDPTRHRERKRFSSSKLRQTQSSSNGREVEFFPKFFSGPGGGGDGGGAKVGRSGGGDGRSRHDDVSRRDGEGPDSTTLRPRPRFCTSSKSPKVNASLSDFD